MKKKPHANQRPGASEEKNNFNFLRLVLASFVALSHSSELLDGNRSREILQNLTGQMSFGDAAVAGLFVISGFLVTQSWRRDPRFWKFLAKRARRLYPGFIVASLASAFLVGPLSGPEYLAHFDYPGYFWSLVFLKTPHVPPVFAATQPYASVNGALWSISHEARCYWAVAILGLFSLQTRLARYWITILLVGWMMAWLASSGNWFPAEISGHSLYNPFFLRSGAYFIAGVVICLSHEKIKFHPAGIILALALLVTTGLLGGFALGWMLGGSYLLFYFAFREIPWLRPFRWWPDMSYGTYLYSWPIYKMLIAAKPDFSPWPLFLLNLTLSLLCGYLSWTLIERRFLSRSRRP